MARVTLRSFGFNVEQFYEKVTKYSTDLFGAPVRAFNYEGVTAGVSFEFIARELFSASSHPETLSWSPKLAQ